MREDVGYQCLNVVITRAAADGAVCYGCEIVGAFGDVLEQSEGWASPLLAFRAAMSQLDFEQAFGGFEG